MSASTKELSELLDALIAALAPRESDPAMSRLRAEAIWLRQELAAERLALPLQTTGELYLFYAIAEGLLDDEKDAKPIAERLADGLLD